MNDQGVEVMLFAQAQGNFLGGSLASIRRAAAYAEARGLDVALTAVLHAPTPLTLRMAECSLDARWRVLDLPAANLDQARNAARLALRRQFAAFVDGDDLWCETWLDAACAAAKAEPAVWRPEVLLTFGNDFHTSEGYSAVFQPLHLSNPALLLVNDLLPSGFVAPREVLATHPWPPSDSERGWQAVDRWWSCEVAAGGREHRAIASTFHYRRRPEALLKRSRVPVDLMEGRTGPTRLAGLQIPQLALAARAGQFGL
jgi:hypothetical protein